MKLLIALLLLTTSVYAQGEGDIANRNYYYYNNGYNGGYVPQSGYSIPGSIDPYPGQPGNLNPNRETIRQERQQDNHQQEQQLYYQERMNLEEQQLQMQQQQRQMQQQKR